MTIQELAKQKITANWPLHHYYKLWLPTKKSPPKYMEFPELVCSGETLSIS